MWIVGLTKSPSVSALKKGLGLSSDRASFLKKVLTGEVKTNEAADALVKLGILINSNEWLDEWHRMNTTEKKLTIADSLMKGYGVESLYPDIPSLYYVNMGDTYSITLLYYNGRYQIGSWGDIAEKILI